MHSFIFTVSSSVVLKYNSVVIFVNTSVNFRNDSEIFIFNMQSFKKRAVTFPPKKTFQFLNVWRFSCNEQIMV